MASTFHPQLFRGANNTSNKTTGSCGTTAVTASTTASTSSSVRHGHSSTSPLAGAATSIIPNNAGNTPSSASTTRNNTPSPTTTSSQIHGLQVDSLQFPPHPAFVSSSSEEANCRVRLISANQYADLVYQHSNIKLQDERVLFPWLHGADLPFSAQAENFGFKNGQFQAVPKYRGLFTIAAHGPKSNDVKEEVAYEAAYEAALAQEAEYAKQREHASHHSSSSSSCGSIFIHPSCRDGEDAGMSDSPAPMTVEGEEEHDTTLSSPSFTPSHSVSPSQSSSSSRHATPHARNATSASIATSYSTDSFCSSTTNDGGSSSSSSSSSSLLNSGLASSASSIYSADEGASSAQLSRKNTRDSGIKNDAAPASNTCLAKEECPSKTVQHEKLHSPRRGSSEAKARLVQQQRREQEIQLQFGPEEYTSLLVNSNHPHEILAYESSPEFDSFQRRRAHALAYNEALEDDSNYVCFQSQPIPNNAVSFRHYRLQKFKYLTVSDLVVYHPKGGLHVDAVDVAGKCEIAIRKMDDVRRERGEECVRYNVYVVLEPFHVFEERYPHLVAVDSKAWPTPNKMSFVDREHEESRELTKASLIGENVYLGNSFDVPVAHNAEEVEEEEIHALHSDVSSNFSFALRRSPSLSSISSSTPSILNSPELYAQSQEQQGKPESGSNPNKYSICIEGRDMAAMCSTRNLRERERYLDDLQMQIEREKEATRLRSARGGAMAAPPSPTTSFTHGKKQMQLNGKKAKSGARKRSSAFWFSSGSSSEEDEDEFESTSESSDDGDAYQPKDTHELEADRSDFEEFADEKELELLYDAPQRGHPSAYNNLDADITLSPGRFSMALDENVPSSSSVASRASVAQASGRCVSPPPYGCSGGANLASNHSTPIKLQYKKSKSLNKARELEAAKAKAGAEAAKDRSKALFALERDLSSPREVMEVKTDEIVYMECLSTAQTSPTTTSSMVDAIVEYVVWLRTQARPHLRTSRDLQRACAANHQFQPARYPHQQQPYGSTAAFVPMARRVLIHCLDGYTDSSILALSYVMYDRAISLPQAYLYLQNECKRSFFVYSTDVPFLQAIEKKLNLVVKSQGRERFNDDISKEEHEAILAAERSAREAEAEAAAALAASLAAIAPQKGSATTTRERAKSLLPRPGLFSRSSSKDSTGSCATIKAGSSVSFSTPASPSTVSSLPRGPPPAPRPASASPAMSLSPASALQQKEDVNAVSHAWFHSEHFDGHFPSRVLDYLYLGNLAHASNALMLKELGITHVLSIGESALVPPSKQCAPSSPSSAARARTPTNSLWLEHSLGNITVMDIQDIQDDGVDSILPHLMAGMQFIDAAREAGGKCLVHCRVGVSRSATVVIGQVMKDLNMSLAEAYILVRARRLNILIQPTILFMHTLWTWEEQIRNLNKKNQDKYPAFEKSGRMDWPTLATEIADLNFKYLNC